MAKLDFEKALAKLERIVAEMEARELSLDQMLAKFKEGVALAAACSKRLHDAERSIDILMKSDDGSIETKPFTGGASSGGGDAEAGADTSP